MIIVLGAGGQVGRALLASLGDRGIGLRRAQADLGAPLGPVFAALDRIQPRALINAAAYTQVDRAETEKDASWRINAEAPGELACWAAQRGIPFVHYSTDYVFADTPGVLPRSEQDSTGPLNHYGMSKLEGERRIQEQGGKHLIFRTSWIYDAQGKNFLRTILKLASEKEILSIVEDQMGAPTFAGDLAEASLKALDLAMGRKEFPSGIYHLTSSGETSWRGFAAAIVERAREIGVKLRVREILPIPTSRYPRPAARPRNSRLSNKKFKDTFGFAMRPWKEALRECLNKDVVP